MAFHDQQERDQIQAILADLPYGHAARAAFRGGADALTLAKLVNRQDISARLIEAWEEGYLRTRGTPKGTP